MGKINGINIINSITSINFLEVNFIEEFWDYLKDLWDEWPIHSSSLSSVNLVKEFIDQDYDRYRA